MSLGRDDFDTLSQAETAALEAAFGDGFDDVGAAGYQPMPPPPEVKGSLTRHSYFVSGTSGYDHEESPEDFWKWSDDRPPHLIILSPEGMPANGIGGCRPLNVLTVSRLKKEV